MANPLADLDGFTPTTILFIGIIALLFFGEGQLEVARTWGKKFIEFRKRMRN
jgi:Sec-independent protein translocase protein TatA